MGILAVGMVSDLDAVVSWFDFESGRRATWGVVVKSVRGAYSVMATDDVGTAMVVALGASQHPECVIAAVGDLGMLEHIDLPGPAGGQCGDVQHSCCIGAWPI
jgi:hypothetical protein